MLKIRYQTAFKKDYKKLVKRGLDIKEFENIIDLLANEKILPDKNKDHQLTGNWIGFRECHIQPDLLLIYQVNKDILTLTLVRTGSHSDLF